VILVSVAFFDVTERLERSLRRVSDRER
jgi:hypothetical protein